MLMIETENHQYHHKILIPFQFIYLDNYRTQFHKAKMSFCFRTITPMLQMTIFVAR